MKKQNPQSYGWVKLANTAAVLGTILYCGGRFIDAAIRFSDYTMRQAQILQFHGLALLAVIITMICIVRVNREVLLATMVPLTLYIFLLTGSLATEDFEFFFILHFAIFSICCLYQNFKSSMIYLTLTTMINVSLFFFYFSHLDVSVTRVAYSSNRRVPSGVLFIDALIGLIASLALLVLTRVASRKSGEANRDLNAFDTLLASTPNYMALINGMKQVMYISEPLAHLANTEYRETATGRPLLDLFKSRELKLLFCDIIDSDGFMDETRELVIDGQTKYYQIIASKLLGITDGMFIDLTDVTPVIYSKLEADDARHAAEHANRAKSDFLARMSHEIRTPMNAIIGMGDLMRTDNLDKIQTGYFNDIRRSSKALMQIINDILDFSKIEAEKLDIIPINFNLNILYDNMCSLNAFATGVKDLEFRAEFGGDVPEVVYGDEIRVRQILNNLLSNAIKYTRAGFVSFKVLAAEQMGGGFIAFVVEDSGIGIKEEDIPKLFISFEQIDVERNRGIVGTGLGLSIVKRLTDLMGGRIEVYSEYGEGSRFTVYLPLPPGDPAKIENIQSIPNVIAKPGTSALVVDDNQINLTVARAFLSAHGVDVDLTASGYDAIDKIQKRQYDIVFMDHMMPDIDGMEVTRRIRATDTLYLRSLPIIALTANAIIGEREAFFAAGMSDYLAKPILSEDMNRMLQKWLPAGKILRYEEQTRQDDPAGAGRSGGGKIDTKRGLMFSAGSKNMYGQLLSDFHRTQREAFKAIEDGILGEDAALVFRLAHTFKNTARTIGADDLADAALIIEEEVSGGEIRRAGEQMFTLRQELQNALIEIGRLIGVGGEYSQFGEGNADKSGEDFRVYIDNENSRLTDDAINGAREFIDNLTPLVKSHRAAAFEHMGEIGVLSPFGEAARTLTGQIENYDFKGALETIGNINDLLSEAEKEILAKQSTKA